MSKWKIQGYDVEDVQKKIFEIFLEFDRICKAHNLTYTLEGGTLLGAVLYRGFIPWDDDMDIVMLRKDYDEFRKVANKELAKPYYFMDMEMSDQYPFMFGKIFNLDTIYKERGTAKNQKDTQQSRKRNRNGALYKAWGRKVSYTAYSVCTAVFAEGKYAYKIG